MVTREFTIAGRQYVTHTVHIGYAWCDFLGCFHPIEECHPLNVANKAAFDEFVRQNQERLGA